tara:strand:- start:22 stop:1170 length:1149 start_codon:yes stop_codon:yes gene_type:complete
MEITRQALYEAVWSSPRKELASAWGIDPNTITYASKKKNIPLPKPGHWTLVSMGQLPSQPALTGDPEETITLEDKPRKPRQKKPPSDNPKVAMQKARTSGPLATVSSEPLPTIKNPVTSISDALPIVRKAYKTYSSPKAARDHKYQHVLPGSAEVIRIAVMPEMVERALLLMDTILREFHVRHWKIHTPSASDRTKNSVIVDGVEIFFTITEHRRQERVKSESRWTTWDYRYHSTGNLRFQFGTYSWMHEIKDNKRASLEERVPELIEGISKEVARVKQVEIDRKHREHIERLENQLSDLVRKAIDYNHQCDKRFRHYIAQYEEALRIRNFVKELRANEYSEHYLKERADWLTWLESKADRIDPIKQQKSLDFSVPAYSAPS